jgi:hypothetical protein
LDRKTADTTPQVAERISEALVPELKAKANIELSAEAVELKFDSNHNLVNRLLEQKASQTPA